METKNQNLKNKAQTYDVIIIGGGAAGISAALWCDELGLNALLLESKRELGGQLLRVYNPIKNHLGVETENGQELRDIFVKQIKGRKFSIEFESKVSEVDLKTKRVFLENGKTFSARALVIATGVRRRKLNIKGEEEFRNHGIIESGKRDAELIGGKRVCIVGGGDAAVENALILSETAAQVFIVHRRSQFSARPEFIGKVQSNKKIKIFTETVLSKILGKTNVESVELRNTTTGETTALPVEAVLLRIGVEPNTELFRDALEFDKSGYIKTEANCQTSLENIFAIGDVANPLSPTVSTAVGTGAVAAKVIYDKINQKL